MVRALLTKQSYQVKPVIDILSHQVNKNSRSQIFKDWTSGGITRSFLFFKVNRLNMYQRSGLHTKKRSGVNGTDGEHYIDGYSFKGNRAFFKALEGFKNLIKMLLKKLMEWNSKFLIQERTELD